MLTKVPVRWWLVLSTSCVLLVRCMKISINGTLPSKKPARLSATMPDNGPSIQITCSMDFMSLAFMNQYFQISIFRCLYKGQESCHNQTVGEGSRFCPLFRAFQVESSTMARYCGCQDLTCQQLNINTNVTQGSYRVTLPSATCQDAGQYVCRTEEIDTHTSTASASVEMLPAEVELYASLGEGEASTIPSGSDLLLTCRVFSTLPVRRFIWTFKDTSSSHWRSVSSDMATIRSSSPTLRQRCDVPWISQLRRYIDRSDERRQYRCSVSYIYDDVSHIIHSPIYSLNMAVNRAPTPTIRTPTVINVSESDLDLNVSGPDSGIVRQSRQGVRGVRLVDREPEPPSSLPAVLVCLAVLVVGALLCLTTMLLTEPNFTHWSMAFFRSTFPSSIPAPIAPGRSVRSRRHRRSLTMTTPEWLESDLTVRETEGVVEGGDRLFMILEEFENRANARRRDQDSSSSSFRNNLAQALDTWVDDHSPSLNPTSTTSEPAMMARNSPVFGVSQTAYAESTDTADALRASRTCPAHSNVNTVVRQPLSHHKGINTSENISATSPGNSRSPGTSIPRSANVPHCSRLTPAFSASAATQNTSVNATPKCTASPNIGVSPSTNISSPLRTGAVPVRTVSAVPQNTHAQCSSGPRNSQSPSIPENTAGGAENTRSPPATSPKVPSDVRSPGSVDSPQNARDGPAVITSAHPPNQRVTFDLENAIISQNANGPRNLNIFAVTSSTAVPPIAGISESTRVQPDVIAGLPVPQDTCIPESARAPPATSSADVTSTSVCPAMQADMHSTIDDTQDTNSTTSDA